MQHPIYDKIKRSIREVPNFPKPGINFYDITTVLKNGILFHDLIDVFAEKARALKVDAVVGIEARGFIFGASVAQVLGLGFIPVRKPGKLPHDKESVSYSLEYGKDTLEIHRDAIGKGERVVLVDDLLATGGTSRGSIDLIERLGGVIAGCLFAIELTALKGRERLLPIPVTSLVQYED